jgi:aspartyl-tRNA(Asn)/glutamyl-tRNA(Gln) amidotransferase subunit C
LSRLFRNKIMSLTLDEVYKIANLARLELSAAEAEQYRRQLSAILDYAERLNELDLTAVPAAISATNLQNVLRDDQATPTPPREELLFNAPQLADEQFLIQTALDDAR